MTGAPAAGPRSGGARIRVVAASWSDESARPRRSNGLGEYPPYAAAGRGWRSRWRQRWPESATGMERRRLKRSRSRERSMAQDNGAPADETRVPQARRLAEQAMEAERAGDVDAAERLFAEAERIDPGVVEAVLEED